MMNEGQERAAGMRIVKMLGLEKLPNEPGWNEPRYYTDGGTKTALGVWRTVKGWVDDVQTLAEMDNAAAETEQKQGKAEQ